MAVTLRAVLFDLDGTVLDTAPDMVDDGYLNRPLDLLDWLKASGRL